MSTPKRQEILEKAIDLTTGDRNKTYGSPLHNLTCMAMMVEAYLRGLGWSHNGAPLDAVDMAVIMDLVKNSRIAMNKLHLDNYIDASAYSAIAGECAEKLYGGV